MVSVLAAQRVRAIKTEGGRKNLENQYAIEMLNITKKFPGIIANDNITLQLKKGEIHALLGENGAGKSTLMSVLFGLYQPEEGIIKKDGEVVAIKDPNDATALGIGMVHQHFKLVDVFTVLDNIILGAETTKCGFLQKKEARKKVEEISKRYGLNVDLDAKVEDITVGMQQRVEILKMLYRDNEILIFDEPTAVFDPAGDRGADGHDEGVCPRRQVHPLHLPQAQRDHGGLRPRERSAQGQVHRHGQHEAIPPSRSFPT